MKIIHIRASNFYGGPERQLHIHALRSRGTDFDITVGSFSEKGLIPEFLQVIAADDIPIKTFDVKSAYDYRAIGLVRDYLKENDIDLLCTHDYRTHLIGFRAVKGAKTGWIAFSRGWTAENIKVRLYHALDKFVVRFADKIVAVSDEQKRRLKSLLIGDGKIAVVQNAIDPAGFAEVERADLKKRFGFPDDSIVCISGGRFSKEKGQSYLVDAARTASEQNPRLRFVIFGDGPDLEKINSRVEELGLSETVLCPGFERDLLGYLKDADMLVNPSLSEGLPNIVLEAMALKIPVVATSVGGVPELVEDGVSGFLVPPADSNLLADKILQLAGRKDIQEKFAREGYRTIVEKFSFDSQAEKLYRVYREALKRD